MTERPSRTTVTTLLLVPLLVAGGLLWGTWAAGDRLRTVEAAVVNLDEMVTVNGQPTPLGRQLAAELVDSTREQNLTWILANEEGAREGLESGRFAAVVTIPREFSASATSFTGPPAEAVHATITVETSEIIGINETALGQAIADAAAHALNDVLTSGYLSGIYLGFNELGARFIELRDGTRQLADGAALLADGTSRSADGADQLAAGLATASAGGAQLRDGVDQSADGAGRLADGADQLAAGARQLASGTGAYADGAGEFAAGVRLYADGAGQYATGSARYAEGVALYTDGVAQYVGVVNPLVVQVRALVELIPAWDAWIDDAMAWVAELPQWAAQLDARVQDVAQRLRDVLERLRDLIARGESLETAIGEHRAALDTPIPCPAELADTDGGCAAFADGVAAATAAATAAADDLVARSADWSASAAELDELFGALLAAVDRLAALSGEFAQAAPELQERLLSLTAGLPSGTLPTKADLLGLLDQFISGGDQLVTGGRELADGATQLADGATALAGGADQLGVGATRFAGGVGELGDGVGLLAGGLGRLADGVARYTSGIDQAASGSAALAGGLADLAGGAGDLSGGVGELAAGVAAGAGEIPTYTDGERATLAEVVASPIDTSTLGGIVLPRVSWASLLLVMALWLGALATYAAIRPIGRHTAYSSATNATLLWRTLGPGIAIAGAHAVLLAVLGALVVGLPPGRSAALAGALVLAAATFAAVNHALAGAFGDGGRLVSLVFLLLTLVPAITSAAPGVFDSLRPLSPLSPALDAVRAVMTGGSPTLPLLLLVAWLLLAVTASTIAVARSRTVPLRAVLAA